MVKNKNEIYKNCVMKIVVLCNLVLKKKRKSNIKKDIKYQQSNKCNKKVKYIYISFIYLI